MTRLSLPSLLLAAGCASMSPPVSSTPTSPAGISESSLRADLFALAADSTMGRETGSEGAYKASAWVAARFQQLGLQPAGENGAWFQTVPFWTVRPDPASRLLAGTTELGARDLLPAIGAVSSATLDNTRAIYGGLANDTTTWIPAERARGRLVILDSPPGSFRLGGSSMYWRGAAGLALVILDGAPAERVARLREGTPSWSSAPFPGVVPVVWLSRRAAAALLGADPRTLQPGTESRVPMRGSFGVAYMPVAWTARNVVGLLRGSDPRLANEYIVLSAHHDHVGFDHSPVDHDSLRAFNQVVRPAGADSPVREPTADEWRRIRASLDSLRRLRAPRLDSIRNGADDDGSGTVGLLAIAERMTRGGERPRRSILFISHTAEEAGLLGSRWYADHPTVPRDSIVGNVDMDMIGRGGATDLPAGGDTYLEVVGAKRLSTTFGEMLEAANARQRLPFHFNYEYDVPGHPLQYYCRADHFSYARWGIPAVSLARGEHMDYHQVTDEAQYIDYGALARVATLVHDFALAVANADQRPALSVTKPDPNVPCRQ